MNYAALIATLAALAFALPFLVTVAERVGVPRGYGIVTTLAAALFALAWILVRQRVQRRTDIEERIAAIERQRRLRPNDPDAFYLHGDHQGDLYLTLGKPREALVAFEAHLALAQQLGRETGRLEQAVARLRCELGAGVQTAQGGDGAGV